MGRCHSMWNKLKIVKQPKERPLLKKILAMVFVTLAVLGLVALIIFWNDLHMDARLLRLKYWRAGGNDEYGSYHFDAHNSNCYTGFDDGLAVASVGGLSTYSEDGNVVFVSQSQLSLPQIKAAGKTVMTFDVGGNCLLAIHKNTGEVLRVDTEKAILDADISTDGDICYLSSEGGYKSVLTVYNEKQELVYRWLSTSTYMPVCAISPKGNEMAAIGLDQKDGEFASTLNLFRTDTDQIVNTVHLGGDLIYDLMYQNDDTLCAIGESGVTYLTAEGEVLQTYSYEGKYLKDYDNGGNGFLALSLNTYRAGNRYSLVVMDETMEEPVSVYVGQEILDLSAAGKYIAVLTTKGLTVYDRNLVICSQTQNIGAATSVLMRPDGTALLLGGGTGQLYIP